MNDNPLVSIIVATLNRLDELKRLLKSIEKSTYKNLEVIIVDQNEKFFLQEIISNFSLKLNIKHIFSNRKGVSINKNIGFKECTGEIITFSDDDSYYENDTIEKAVRLLDDFGAISGRPWCPLINKRSLIRSANTDKEINAFNYFSDTIEFAMFWKRQTLQQIGNWDELLGVGGKWGSEGGADLVIRCLKNGIKIKYFSDLIIFHQNQLQKNPDKIFSYSKGHGAFMAKSIFIEKNWRFLPYSFLIISASLCKIPFYFLQNDHVKKSIYRNRINGIVDGFYSYYIHQIKKK